MSDTWTTVEPGEHVVQCPYCYALVLWSRVPDHSSVCGEENEDPRIQELTDRIRDLEDTVNNDRDIWALDLRVSDLETKLEHKEKEAK